MQPRQGTHHFQMAQLFRANVHQQVLTFGVVAVESLNGVLHRGRKLPVGAAKLLEEHVPEAGIGLIHSDGIHQLLDVVIHRRAPRFGVDVAVPLRLSKCGAAAQGCLEKGVTHEAGTGRVAVRYHRELMDIRRPQVSSLGLYTAFYLIILGATYLVLPVPFMGSYPAYTEIRGAVYVFAGVTLLWAAIDALKPHLQQGAYVAAGILILATASDLATRGTVGAAFAHALLGVAVLAGVRPDWNQQSQFSLLGVALGGAQACVGLDGLFGGTPLPGIPTLHVSGAMVAAAYTLTGLAVVAASTPYSDRARPVAHAAAGGVLLAHLLAITLVFQPTFLLSGAASWFRAVITVALPWSERRVRGADSRTLRARTGATFVTLAAVAATLPATALVLIGPAVSVGGPPQPGRVVAFALIVALVLASGIAGVTTIGGRLARAIEDVANSGSPERPMNLSEFDRVAAAVRHHAAEVDRLGRRLAEQDDQVGGISHDLRNPLSAIMTAASVLSVGADNPQHVARAAGVIRRQATRMRGLIDNLVQSAQLDTGSYTAQVTRLPVEAWLRDLQQQFHTTDDESRVAIEPVNAEAMVDPSALGRIVSNLVDNALKFSTGVVTVRASVAPGRVVFRVVDHGPGIPADMSEQLFDRYVQRDDSRRREGFGLGLYIARRLARANGGDLTLEATPGGGATFAVTVPAAAAEEPAPAGAAPGATMAVNG